MRYINERYKEYYKKLDRERKYVSEKKDYSDFIVIVFIVFLFLSPLIFVMAVSITSENDKERNKDKLIEIDKNSLGCIKYSYNTDIIWKCPKESNITQVETKKCTSNGKTRSCSVIQEPVVDIQ